MKYEGTPQCILKDVLLLLLILLLFLFYCGKNINKMLDLVLK